MKLLETGMTRQMKILLANCKHSQKSMLVFLFHPLPNLVRMYATCKLQIFNFVLDLEYHAVGYWIRMRGVTIVQEGKTDDISDGKTGM
jgi:hypothetical protein